MFNVNDIKNGMTIKYEGNIYQVVEFQHVKPGKGSAFVKTKLKNFHKSGKTEEGAAGPCAALRAARAG